MNDPNLKIHLGCSKALKHFPIPNIGFSHANLTAYAALTVSTLFLLIPKS